MNGEMLDDYRGWEQQLSNFELASWALCGLTFALLLYVLMRRRDALLKPSVLAVIVIHVQVQWAAAIRSASIIEAAFDKPWHILLLCQGVPLITLIGALWMGRVRTAEIWARLPGAAEPPRDTRQSAIVILLVLAAGIVGLYLSVVPITQTGLYAMLFRPEISDWVRESSLKLLPNVYVQYAFALLAGAVVPLLAAYLTLTARTNVRAGRYLNLLPVLGALLLLTVAVSLPGTRIATIYVLFAVVLTWQFANQVSITPDKIAVMAGFMLALLAVPAALSLLRNDDVLSWEMFLWYVDNSAIGRVFFAPLSTGLGWVFFAQENGHVGIAGIAKLAELAGETPVDMANLIGLTYERSNIPSVSAVTSFIFAYYAYFGLWGAVLSIAGLWLLDFALLAYRYLSDRVLIPTVVALAVATVHVVETELTTLLVTHGFLPALGIAFVLDWMTRAGRRDAIDHEPRRVVRTV